MKKIEKEIVINATPEAVWRAMTEGEELKRWFPLDARVKPGAGGSVWFSFGEGSEWESPIEIWEPSRHLRTVDEMPQADGAPPLRIAVDYFIEARGGQTVVRLVHSGFADSTWEGELESLKAGWEAFMGNLRHYLELHAGQKRFLAFFRHPAVPVERWDAFRRTLSVLGISADGLAVGTRFDAKSRSGDRFTGEVQVFVPPQAFTGTAENWNDAWLMVEIEPGKESCRPAIWLSLYGKAMAEGPRVQERIKGLLEGEFGAAGAER